jgi:hypothetical protein
LAGLSQNLVLSRDAQMSLKEGRVDAHPLLMMDEFVGLSRWYRGLTS